MKRLVISLSLLAVFVVAQPARAQSNVSQLAAWQDVQADLKRLNARIEDLLAANEALQRQVADLKEDVRKLEERLSTVETRAGSSADQAAIKKLADAIEEVDRKRIADNKKVLEALDKLQSLFTSQIAKLSTATAPVKLVPRSDNAGSGKGYEYTIKPGDTLSRLVTALRKAGFKISMQQVMDANPGVDWNRLQVGQKIFIPALEK